MRPSIVDAAGMAAGYALDAVAGDPRRFHPVAGFGHGARALERLLYAPDRLLHAPDRLLHAPDRLLHAPDRLLHAPVSDGAPVGLLHAPVSDGAAVGRDGALDRRDGALFATIAVGVPMALALAAQRATAKRPLARFALTAVTTWAVLGGKSLRREGHLMADALGSGDLPAARERLSHLCGRDPRTLGEPELARATVESIAENTSDAVVAPLFWGAVAGLPGLVAYRAVNTLDAMVGHRSPRYERFGTASARADDAANLVPSRMTGALASAFAPAVGGDCRQTFRVWRRFGQRHPSPNSGQCEASFAGALGIRLGGTNVYFGRSETRPVLGDGRAPATRDIRRAARLSALVGLGALTIAALIRTRRP